MFVVAIASLLLITLAAVTASACFFDPFVVRILVVLAVSAWLATALYSGILWDRSRKWWGLIGLCLSIAMSVTIVDWPLHLGFRLSQAACNRLATEIRLGHNVVMPQRAGLFLVREAGVNRHGIVYLWVDPDPGGSKGLVKCGADSVTGEFNLFYTFQLSKDWQFVIED